MDLFDTHIQKAKEFNMVTNQLPLSIMPTTKAMEGFKSAGRDIAMVYDKLPPGAIETAESMTNIADAVVNFDEQFTKWDAAAGNFVAAADQKLGAVATGALDLNNKLGGYFDQMAGFIWKGFTQPFTDALSAFNSLKGAMEGGIAAPVPAPSPTPTPHQFGGIFSRPHIGMVAERGAEAIIPLHGGSRSAGLLSQAASALGFRPAGGGATHVSFAPNITINGPASEQNQRALDDKVRNLARDFIENFKAAQAQERRLSYEGGYG
jgi:hypothetical protein